LKKPLLFLIFNRLDTTQKVFEQIKIAKPPKLYIASDGARESVEGEDKIVSEVRKYVLNNIDWDCEVKTKFNDENLGCGRAISGAITWFFENEPEGIILEDDCVPNQSFFPYCEELLEKYRDDKRVWHIASTGFYQDDEAEDSYYFAKIMHCWGWAGWADRWKKYRFDLDWFDKKLLSNFSSNKQVITYFRNILNQMKGGKIDTWDYQYTFLIIANNGFCINPYKNLISNIGENGIHFSSKSPLMYLPAYEIGKLKHPTNVKFNHKAIKYIYSYSILQCEKPKSILAFIVRKLPPLFRKDFYEMLTR